ncbi:acyl-protein thioesterase [Histoplasma capsulatum G186AR]|nr:acyl-protein thioesterase [Histoplasma capsulatum]QSS76486.1 acyl-protein thioesterase [Histoplasma capsulatum G186AR]
MTMPPQKRAYPEPLVIAPLKPNHTHTLILLHGRGSNAERFGHELLESAKLRARLPTVKFVFPTASKRRSTVLKKTPINQWFDNYSLEDPGRRTDLQVDGLCQTAEFLRNLIAIEATLLGPGGYGRIVLGGLSQGCAASIFTLLGGGFGPDGSEQLGGFVGMSGWLPFESQLHDLAESHTSDSDGLSFGTETDPFAGSTDDVAGEQVQALEALNHVRDILDLPALTIPKESACSLVVDYLPAHVFIGHGAVDPKVSVHLGEKMATFLSDTLRMHVTWKAYEDLGHWYGVPDEIEDIVYYLRRKVGIPECQ